jgi:hypothetical protein
MLLIARRLIRALDASRVERLKDMRKRVVFLISFIITLFLSLSVIGLSQDNKILQVKDEALDHVPSANRERLVERLKLYIGSSIKGELSDIYDLMPDGCKHGLRKDEWLKQARYAAPGRLQKFILKDAYTGDYDSPEILPGEKWIIKGCGIYATKNGVVGYETSYSTLLMNGEWYICNTGNAVEGNDNDYIVCSE